MSWTTSKYAQIFYIQINNSNFPIFIFFKKKLNMWLKINNIIIFIVDIDDCYKG